MEIYVDDETKLTLHGLQQYYLELSESEKNRKLNDLLDELEFNQVVIFVSKVSRARELNRLLTECNFPSICIHGAMRQEERCVLMLRHVAPPARRPAGMTRCSVVAACGAALPSTRASRSSSLASWCPPTCSAAAWTLSA